MDSTPTSALAPGTQLRNGDFTLVETLGQGGFGITYRALDNTLHRDAAIKEFFPRGAARDESTHEVLAPSSSEFAAAKEEFLHEARALAQFNHPNIVDVYSVFEENGTAYMVMEWVRGSTLTQAVEARGVLSEDEALRIIKQAGAALAEVHARGLLHLDVKPDNVMLDEAHSIGSQARAVLLDFGMTKKIETVSGYGTMRLDAWSRFGTPGFAAIEQYSQNSTTGVYTDVYGLAATLFFLLTGTEPPEAASRATGTALPDLQTLAPNISHSVASAVAAAMSLPTNLRPQSVDDFLTRLKSENDGVHFADVVVPQQSTFGTTPEPQAIYHDPFAADDPFGQTPIPTPTQQRPRPFNPNNPFSDPNYLPRSPFTILPFGFGCGSIGCSIGCFLFIAIFLLIIASMMNSVSVYLPF
jgi:serine/threonine-protein kinase